jgi:hypothetical protein
MKNTTQSTQIFRRQCEIPKGIEYEHHILSLAICVEVFQIICDILHINLQKQTYCFVSARELAFLGTSRIVLCEIFTATSLKRSKTTSIARARQLRVCSYCERCSRNIPDMACGTVIKDTSSRPIHRSATDSEISQIYTSCMFMANESSSGKYRTCWSCFVSKDFSSCEKIKEIYIYIYIYISDKSFSVICVMYLEL